MEAIAKETGVGPATLYRHFPTRDELLAAVLQMNSDELDRQRTEIERIDAPAEALDRWLRALEDYFSAFQGLPGPLMTAVQRPNPDNPLTIPCDALVPRHNTSCTPRRAGGGCARRFEALTCSWRRAPSPRLGATGQTTSPNTYMRFTFTSCPAVDSRLARVLPILPIPSNPIFACHLSVVHFFSVFRRRNFWGASYPRCATERGL
nr:TetR/AcrR family transcriptional regulator [Rhodococcus qingshengii]